LLPQTELSPELVSAYHKTEFRFDGEAGSVSLRTGEYCNDLDAIMRDLGCRSACYITAFNARSSACPEEDNVAANGALRADILRMGLSYRDGIGIDPSDKWPGEPSFLVFGITFDGAQSLGAKYGQNAIVWIDDDAIPTLMLLR
jgi:hypothetical protein